MSVKSPKRVLILLSEAAQSVLFSPKGGGGGMGSHGAVGKGGGGKEKGKPGSPVPGAAAAASAVDEVGWLEAEKKTFISIKFER